ncbi:hypothetical protein NA56DRAFT_706594 [Hyaloscypha hepaticicola]|uniref:Uncharacterized protein n=1 Tax=Hyaloscypha hepaticicola TaxID=2082293 RepID=A0A2J6PXH9_9HELO|nr:hypothetical protein NA56DRAFT_706594 [Hyaloscypha hepaticicola]
MSREAFQWIDAKEAERPRKTSQLEAVTEVVKAIRSKFSTCSTLENVSRYTFILGDSHFVAVYLTDLQLNFLLFFFFTFFSILDEVASNNQSLFDYFLHVFPAPSDGDYLWLEEVDGHPGVGAIVE